MAKSSKELTRNEKRVYDILMMTPRISTQRVIYNFWKDYIAGPDRSSEAFARDFVHGKVPFEGVSRAYRKVREKYPEICTKRKQAKQEEYYEHYSSDVINPAQGNLL